MNSYRIGDHRYASDAENFQSALESAKLSKTRPLCMCVAGGVPVYISQISGRLILKRMPNSGGEHAPACDSYEPPAELSGLGQVMGSAIQEDPDDGLTALKLDFSLSKTASRAARVPSGTESDSVKTDGHRLTLRSVLHLLWDQAGFNRWSPAMQGRRSWFVIRKHLLQAAEGKVAKGQRLIDVLYVPETFSVEHKDEIAGRRVSLLAKAGPVGAKGARQLMIVVGDVKEIAISRYGHKIVFKHVPDCHFMLSEDLHTRLKKRFATELELWGAIEGAHLIAIATFGVGASGVASVEEVALMIANENWVPFESGYDAQLIDAMARAHRRFVKGLRYNLAQTEPLACLVASDTHPHPTAMYIEPPTATDEYRRALEPLVQESHLASWLWKAVDGQMPALPEPSR